MVILSVSVSKSRNYSISLQVCSQGQIWRRTDYFLKCCLGELSTGHGADSLHRQITVCFYTISKTDPSSHLSNMHRRKNGACTPPEQVHPLSASVFLCIQWVSVLNSVLFQLNFIENRRRVLAMTLSWTLLCVQLDLFLILLNVVTRIVTFVPNVLFVGRFCIEITVKPFSMVFSLQSEKCVKAVEGHTYYNKTKETNKRASILKSSDTQHIIALVISVWIRKVAEERRHLNPAAPFRIHNERDVGVLFPSPFLPLLVTIYLSARVPQKQMFGLWVSQWYCWEGSRSDGLNSVAHLPPSQYLPSPILTVQMFLPGACNQNQIKWLNNQIPAVKIQLIPPPQQKKCQGRGHKTEEKESKNISHYSSFLSPGPQHLSQEEQPALFEE